MKSLALASVLLSVGALVACALEEPAPTVSPNTTAGTGGTTGGTMGGSTTAGTGGVVGAGTGGMATGGSAGSATGGSGGSVTAGTGGVMPTGGTSGSGGSVTAGTAGTGNMGGMGNTGGMGNMGGMSSGGTAGETSMGGMSAGGMAGNPPMAGTGGEVMTPSCPTVSELVGPLDGRIIVMPCGDNPNSDDCAGSGWIEGNGTNHPCQNGRLDSDQTYQINGEAGETYKVTMHFYGVMEPKNYGTSGVTRESGTTRPQNNNSGATPVPWAVGTPNQAYRASDYNTYEIHVLDENDDEIAVYFINSDTQEGHWTYAINYEKTIDVPGQGAIRMRTYDQNCRQIKNCGTGSSGGAQCATLARTIDIGDAMPQPTNLQQPGLGEANQHSGQWFLLDVTAVACE